MARVRVHDRIDVGHCPQHVYLEGERHAAWTASRAAFGGHARHAARIDGPRSRTAAIAASTSMVVSTRSSTTTVPPATTQRTSARDAAYTAVATGSYAGVSDGDEGSRTTKSACVPTSIEPNPGSPTALAAPVVAIARTSPAATVPTPARAASG